MRSTSFLKGSLLPAALAVVLACQARAAVIILNPSKDNTLFQSTTGTESSGSGISIFAGRTGALDEGRFRRAVMAFDLAGVIPSGAIITDVTLTLFLLQAGSGSAGRSVSLHPLTASWGEGSSVGNVGAPGTASAGDATWLHRFHSATPWTTAGGDFESAASASTIINGANKSYSWSGPALVEDVQTWATNPAVNFGWLFRGDETALSTALRFTSRETVNAAQRPQLTVTYNPVPEPSCAGLLSLGVLLLGGRTLHRPRACHEL
ncbi:MAG: hypothetical protein JWQ44_193 [Chthoniobacter sp.]|jgi:hypothetical protein|nr:hypothetical protein [Chthoniobacter sp.]